VKYVALSPPAEEEDILNNRPQWPQRLWDMKKHYHHTGPPGGGGLGYRVRNRLNNMTTVLHAGIVSSDEDVVRQNTRRMCSTAHRTASRRFAAWCASGAG
jgi:hypothetical protein